MGDSSLATIVRPNGKAYRPRKVVAHRWENDDFLWSGGVVVLGTHDIERAHKLAMECCEYWFNLPYANTPEVGWYRLGYSGATGEQSWVYDEVSGRAGVMFTAGQDPAPSSSVDEGNPDR